MLSNDGAAGFTLLDPLGEVVFSGQPGDQTVVAMPASGTYTLVADAAGDATGGFSFQLVDQTAPPPVITNAGPAAGSTLPEPGVQRPARAAHRLRRLRDITALGQLTYTGTTFNRQTETLHAAVQLTNVGPDPLGNLVVMAFDGFTPPAAYLANPDTTHPDDGRPLIVYTTADLGLDGLRPGETSDADRPALRQPGPGAVRLRRDAAGPGQPRPDIHLHADHRRPRWRALRLRRQTPPTRTATPSTFRLLAGPAGMTVDPASGLVQWTPDPDQAGTQSVILTVEDGRGGSDTQTLTLRFPVVVPAPLNAPPVIVSTPPGMPLVNGQAFTYDVHAIDPDGDAVRYLLGRGPAGMTIDPITGLINWTASGGLSQWANSVIAFSTQFSAARQLGRSPGHRRAEHVRLRRHPHRLGARCRPTGRRSSSPSATPPRSTPAASPSAKRSATASSPRSTSSTPTTILHTVWTGTDPSQPGAPVDFLVSFPTTPYLVKGVKVYMDINHSGSWEEIDAVALHGAALADVTVVAEDGRGGFDTQTFVLNVTQSDTPLGSISGTLFDDADGDRVRDANEGPLPGWTVYLDTDGDGVRERFEPATITAADGSYRFDGLPAGQYTVREVLQPGWLQTLPGGEGSPGDAVHYVDWTSANVSAGTASGVILLPGGSTVTVGFQAINPNGSAGNLFGAPDQRRRHRLLEPVYALRQRTRCRTARRGPTSCSSSAG